MQEKSIDDLYIYSEADQIGEGAYSKVYLGKRKLNPKELLAIKVISLEGDQQSINSKLNSIIKEIQTLFSLYHPNIIRIYDFKTFGNLYFLISEFIQGNDLYHFVKDYHKINDKPIPESVVIDIFKQLVEVFHYLHSQNYSHLDLKPSNIMYNNGRIKLIDFGFAKQTTEDESCETVYGTPYFMHPKLSRAEKYLPKEADMWSLGVTIYFLLFYNKENKSKKNMNYPQFENSKLIIPNKRPISKELSNLLTRMLDQKKQLEWTDLNDFFKIKDTPFEKYQATNTITINTIQCTVQAKQINSNEINEVIQRIRMKIQQLVDKTLFIENIDQQFNQLSKFYSQEIFQIYICCIKSAIEHIWNVILKLHQGISDRSLIFYFDQAELIKLRKMKEYQDLIKFLKRRFLTFGELYKKVVNQQLEIEINYILFKLKAFLNLIDFDQGLNYYDFLLIDCLYNLIVFIQNDQAKFWDNFKLLHFLKNKKNLGPIRQLAYLLEFYQQNEQ